MRLWIDGAFVDLAVAVDADASALFETMGRFGGELRLWDRHLVRLRSAMQRCGDATPPPIELAAVAGELLRDNGHDVLRLERLLRPRGGSWRLQTRARTPSDLVRLLPTVTRRPAAAPPADLKATPRAFYDAVLCEARAGGADDGIVLGDDGALLETAVGNLWLLLDSVWTTPPLDGRVLPGIARALLLERARSVGIPVQERPCYLGDLHRAQSMCVSNAVHGPRSAILVGGPVGEAGSSLARLWRFAVAD